ncbi:MAG: response regulator [Flavobacteriales bacterium]|nr:response regulator [Flavobacteriales bacterium]
MERNSPIILIAEDDPDDRLIIEEALEENQSKTTIKFVHDGQELIDYLEQAEKQAADHAMPNVIMLDLNMPKIDGREALRYVKGNVLFKKIPTIILTTSRAAEDIEASYDLGVNSFITKPSNFSGMTEIIGLINKYWFETVELPKR